MKKLTIPGFALLFATSLLLVGCQHNAETLSMMTIDHNKYGTITIPKGSKIKEKQNAITIKKGKLFSVTLQPGQRNLTGIRQSMQTSRNYVNTITSFKKGQQIQALTYKTSVLGREEHKLIANLSVGSRGYICKSGKGSFDAQTVKKMLQTCRSFAQQDHTT